MSKPAYEHPFRVALHDTDAAGVLFFAHLFRRAHDAYEAWMASLGFPLPEMIREGRIALPLVHAEADYRRPLRHGDGVQVEISIAALETSRFSIDYRFQTEQGTAATARTVHACIHPGEKGARPLPEPLHAMLRACQVN
ncbi:acyl-CoA thioesterase [Thiohalocapsa marina]|uniref:Acyl-CoA thioesterase n=1 Tax=Thiohalocapsa marina TaxID=424902 RepID=A0A5M8FQH3_9GAMM|nr:thioesterase family protein [Thiohalocapsa marina]KAA6186026.1 acyl-CoA thioesterase [Thiohalocapsa marina]